MLQPTVSAETGFLVVMLRQMLQCNMEWSSITAPDFLEGDFARLGRVSSTKMRLKTSVITAKTAVTRHGRK